MVKHDIKILNLFEKYFIKYNSTVSLNKNLLLSGTFGFIISLLVALVSSIISSFFSYLTINLIVKYINVFDSTKKKIF
jgi:hypothetical protein